MNQRGPNTLTRNARVNAFALALLGTVGCERAPWDREAGRDAARASASPSDVATVTAPEEVATSPDLCALEIARLGELPAQEGAALMEARRAEILGRARSAPLFFIRAPKGEDEGRGPLGEAVFGPRMRGADPTPDIVRALRKTSHDIPLRRRTFLKEGYLYADDPLLGLRLSQVLRFDHLFQERDLRVQRGASSFFARRLDGRYYSVPAEFEGDEHLEVPVDPKTWEEAALLLFDRPSLRAEPSRAPLHVDFRELHGLLGYQSVKVRRITTDGLVVEFLTGAQRSEGIVTILPETGRALLACETWAPASQGALKQARQASLERRQLVRPILQAAREIVTRRLPFDEPRTEEGQQDGLLRVAFREAYRRYHETYEFNGDSYYVFDGRGHPRLPEVCIDFITDSLDFATGGKWPARGERRVYTPGALNFASFGLENSRSVEQIALFAAEHPSWFDVHLVEGDERVKFYRRQEFFETLAKTASRYQLGDIVFIYGLRDDERFHYHSFFIDEVDPVTGVPILVAANAGPAQVRSWEGEMQGAPRRAIASRVRLKSDLLRRAYAWAKTHPGEPLPPPDPDG